MKKEYAISVVLDKRKKKNSGKYPVKLRVYCSNTKRQKLLPTVFDFTIDEFESIWKSTKPRGDNKEYRLRLQGLENASNQIAEKITPFSIELFEKITGKKPNEGNKVHYHYKELIENYIKSDRIGTADSYKYSQNSIKKFTVEVKGFNYEKLSFNNIDVNWLNDYERYMRGLNRSMNTVGIYLRPLKAIFNKAIFEKEIEPELYPFGKRKYQIPSSRSSKRILSKDQFVSLYYSEPINEQQKKAKAFWFFSYFSNGMNIKDIALLKFKDIDDDSIKFNRAKTLFTSKTDLKMITVYLNDYMKSFIDDYSVSNKDSDNYVFDILSKSMTPQEQHAKIKNFTRFVNQHLKNLSEAIGLPNDISSYWARHSFATISIQEGASMELMQESLGHKDIKTTQAYFEGFDDEAKRKLAHRLMNFNKPAK